MSRSRPYIPTGCDQQGRIEQSQSAQCYTVEPIMHIMDRLREDYDDQSESADGDVLKWLLKSLAVALLACFSAWCIAKYLALANV